MLKLILCNILKSHEEQVLYQRVGLEYGLVVSHNETHGP